MRLDRYSNPIFNEQDLFDALYQGKTISANMFVESSPNVKSLEDILAISFWNPIEMHTDIPLETYDASMQSNWLMPPEYLEFNVKEYCLNKCTNTEEGQRVLEEIAEFESRNMIQLLQWIKFFVDNCTKNNIVWGVGRGSSVASFVLFLLGAHKINSLKYNLDWQEFLR